MNIRKQNQKVRAKKLVYKILLSYNKIISIHSSVFQMNRLNTN